MIRSLAQLASLSPIHPSWAQFFLKLLRAMTFFPSETPILVLNLVVTREDPTLSSVPHLISFIR